MPRMPEGTLVTPAAIAALIDRADHFATHLNGALMRLPRDERRRLLAAAVFVLLRTQPTPQPEPQPSPAPRR